MYLSKKNAGNSGEVKPSEKKNNAEESSFSPFVIGISNLCGGNNLRGGETIPAERLPRGGNPEKKTDGRDNLNVEDVVKPLPETKRVSRKKLSKRTRRTSPERSDSIRKISVITEYAATRRFNIILFSIISLIGVFIGIIYAKDLDAGKLAALRESGNIFYSDIGMSAMTVKILTAILYSAVYIVVIFLGGFTIFAPVVSAAANLIKSVLFGFMTAALIFTAGGKFDVGIAALYVLFGTTQILILTLASSEALGFSIFLLKNEESYKKSLSFPNISLYSIRHVIFLILLSAISVMETVMIPLMYDLMY